MELASERSKQDSGDLKRAMFYMGLAVVISRLVSSFVLPQYDDSFITMRYARNLASGLGFVYNINEHILADTCPAFGLLEALLYLLKLPVPATLLVLNIACDLAILILTLRILDRAGNRLAGILFGVLFALNPVMARICIGGMEVDLFLLCSLLSILFYHQGRKYLGIATASLIYFLRPEAIMLVGLLCLMELFGPEKRNTLLFGLFSLALVSIPLYLIFSYYGTIIPHSVVAKSRWLNTPYWDTLKGLIFTDPVEYVLFPFMLWGMVRAMRTSGVTQTIGIWTAIYVLVYTLNRVFMFSWYGETVHYAELLFASIGLLDLAKRFHIIQWRLFQSGWLAPTFAAITIGVSFAVCYVLGESPVITKVYGPLQEWVNAHPTPGASYMAEDIGVIGYFTNDYIWDSDGLTWPGALKIKSQADMIRTAKPNYLFINATHATEKLLKENADIATVYKPIAFFARKPVNLSGPLPEGWYQDYVLFQRQDSMGALRAPGK